MTDEEYAEMEEAVKRLCMEAMALSTRVNEIEQRLLEIATFMGMVTPQEKWYTRLLHLLRGGK